MSDVEGLCDYKIEGDRCSNKYSTETEQENANQRLNMTLSNIILPGRVYELAVSVLADK